MWMRNCMALVLFGSAIGLAAANPAYPEYRVTIVGPPGSTAADINQAGAVVGSYPVGGATHGFINRGKGLVDLGALKGTSSTAAAPSTMPELFPPVWT